MGVLGIAEVHTAVGGDAQTILFLAVEVGEDGSVVVAGDAEGLTGEVVAILFVGHALFLGQELSELGILGFGGHNDNVFIIFGSSADKRDATDVDFLDDGLIVGTAGHGVLEGIEVYNNEVDLVDVESLELLQIQSIVSASQDAAKDAWVESFDTSAENGGVARDIFYSCYGYAEALNKFLCASSGIYFNAELTERLNNFIETVFVEDRDESGLNFLLIGHDKILIITLLH